MIFAKQALLNSGWAEDVRLTLKNGVIAEIETGAKPDDKAVCVDTLLPALGNLHSHSFQRAMAGMTEYRRSGRDNFWTWRELMYRFVDQLTPNQIQSIAALVFMEMQQAGYASVGEFHYVHHQPGGEPYDNIAELSCSIFAAAEQTGIGLTHLPVLYTYGGAGRQVLSDGQKRFGNDIDRFANLIAAVRQQAAGLPADTKTGIAPHSLRATSPEDLIALLDQHSNGPIHMHIAEQPVEVVDIQSWLGARPVEWLLNNAEVTADWCLIHATHMTDDETLRMAQSGAVAGLCPITEANLGDGSFNGPEYLAALGAFGVGSDSNINISLTEELRTLEYSQRLRDMARNILVPGEGSVGNALYLGAARGAAKALDRNSGQIENGLLADLVAIDSNGAALCALSQEQLLDGLVFAAKDCVVTDVWSAGRHMVRGGQHIRQAAIINNYRAAITELLASI